MDSKKLISIVLPFNASLNYEVLNQLNDSKNDIEIITNDSATASPNKSLKITLLSFDNQKDYLNNAVIVASGKFISLLFTENDVLNISKIVRSIDENNTADIIIGNSSKGLIKKAGIRKITKTYPLIFNRNFLATLLPFEKNNISSEYFINEVIKSDKNSRLFLNQNYHGNENYFNKNIYTIRPYHRLVKRRIFSTKRKNEKTVHKIENEIDKNTLVNIIYTENIPVFINCRDRYKPLVELVGWLENEGLKNIIFLDNDSTYPPLLEYLNKSKYTVLKLGQNMGHRAPWVSGAINVYAHNLPFIVTDPDVIPVKESHGAIKEFIEILNKYKSYCKVGFGLRIDNLPDHYDLKNTVIKWESQFWKNEIQKNIYNADLDTTFALYRPNTKYKIRPSLRTGGKFIAEHEPWYINSANPSQEVLYYRKNADKNVGSWGLNTKDTAEYYKKPNAKIII